ncbi:MAG: hypothetical protein DRO05_08685 [Thermoproteota archaeon]|nr:MAG: hypothetical protein DRO05_08685 [Candidatus Korarchaeota archaeon]
MKGLRTDVLVVGSGVAGISAAIAAKTANSGKEVVLVGEERPYRRPSIFSLIKGGSLEELSIFRKDLIVGVKTLFGVRVRKLDLYDRLAELDNGEKIVFNCAVVATGSKPFVPPFEGSELSGVIPFRSYSDALSVRKMLGIGSKCVIIGAGLIGVKLASILHRSGMKVLLVELKKVLWTLLEEPLSNYLRDLLISNGISVIEGGRVESILGGHRVSSVVIDGRRYEADFVIVVTGVRPRTEIVADQLKLGVRGAIRTDKLMKTSIDGVYACGDCAETIDLVSGRKTYRPIGSIAYKAGKLAGANSVGNEREYNGFIRLQGDDFLGISVTSIGLAGAEAESMGVNFKTLPLKPKGVKVGIYSALFNPVGMFLGIVNGKERLIGFQAVGQRLSRKLINSISSLISSKSNVNELRSIGLEPA